MTFFSVIENRKSIDSLPEEDIFFAQNRIFYLKAARCSNKELFIA